MGLTPVGVKNSKCSEFDENWYGVSLKGVDSENNNFSWWCADFTENWRGTASKGLHSENNKILKFGGCHHPAGAKNSKFLEFDKNWHGPSFKCVYVSQIIKFSNFVG